VNLSCIKMRAGHWQARVETGAKACYGPVGHLLQELWPIFIPPLQSVGLIFHHPVYSCCKLHLTPTMKIEAECPSETSTTHSPLPPPSASCPYTPNHGWWWPSMNVRACNWLWQSSGHTQKRRILLVIRRLIGSFLIHHVRDSLRSNEPIK
jgi:hypothetical protein